MENLDGEPERQSSRAAGTHLNMVRTDFVKIDSATLGPP